MMRRGSILVAIVALASSFTFADSPNQGRNSVTIRGQEQYVYFYPAPTAGVHEKVLFVPGDGGWRGFATEIAEQLQAAGYDVYGVDTRRYLQSFADKGGLKTSEIGGDFRQIAEWIRQGSNKRLLFAGWSEGAGLGIVAVSDGQNKDLFRGLVAIGMAERNLLAWRWSDTWATVAKKMPNEPTFPSAEFVAQVAPLPLFMIGSSHDEYTTVEMTRSLFALAKEPKKLVIIDANDHKYGGKSDEFFRIVKEALLWITQERA